MHALGLRCLLVLYYGGDVIICSPRIHIYSLVAFYLGVRLDLYDLFFYPFFVCHISDDFDLQSLVYSQESLQLRHVPKAIWCLRLESWFSEIGYVIGVMLHGELIAVDDREQGEWSLAGYSCFVRF